MARKFDSETTAREVVADLDLSGWSALVTGASGGLGAETAAALAGRGARVTLAARDLDRAERVVAEIRTASPDAELDVVKLELDSPQGVIDCAQQVAARHDRLDALINNAGVMACPLGRTAQGFELQFATNHLGHFLLTSRLLPLLRAASAARVVNLSSGGHRMSPVVFDDIHFERRDYDKWEAYGQSKSANVLFSVELDARFEAEGLRVFAVHPGAIVTDLGRHLAQEDLAALNARSPGGKLSFKSPGAGAATSTWAATAPELADRGGLYLEDCGIAEVSEEGPGGVNPWALDPEAARRLFEVSEKMLGERFA